MVWSKSQGKDFRTRFIYRRAWLAAILCFAHTCWLMHVPIVSSNNASWEGFWLWTLHGVLLEQCGRWVPMHHDKYRILILNWIWVIDSVTVWVVWYIDITSLYYYFHQITEQISSQLYVYDRHSVERNWFFYQRLPF